ncbi:MAG: class I SAM-dependent methyltransferase [candidate division KSB1 bacterium]|nr:class I SAM-dependent methyltransferase [candidate division KSB1 bacterium]MDZ7275180.1 class I SAM-dependent methyltransferase [candidate division KSB1 bacterium]MDZ7287349.1 class I SAM-dependent methyltransferase [candidate division KSB1 bacterium]MDZ7299463.1 class I SAM-dependent methyltransferase [candidate division KSB1 bacterium]MDZ7305491.1 class I SAM-dependent methyltransferase [candidate division KSB1 bacterium]
MTPLASAIAAMLAHRRPFFETCTAFRLCHHELGRGLTIDYYDGYLLLIYYANFPEQKLAGLAHAVAEGLVAAALPVQGALARFRPDNLSHATAEPDPAHPRATLLFGNAPPPRFTIREYDLQFVVSFEQGHSTGLFLDMKQARQELKQLLARGAQVLNLFSYTGGFSIAAARAGAGRVIEVDTSAKWLQWARENQVLNQVSVVRQRREEAIRFLHKQKEGSFDVIICDPPTYATQKSGSRFTLEKGYASMIPEFFRVLRAGGHLLACTNYHGLSPAKFFRLFGEVFTLRRQISSSADFAGDDYLKVGWFQAKRG